MPSSTTADPGNGTAAQAASTTSPETFDLGEWFILGGTGDDAVYLAQGGDGGVWLVSTVESGADFGYLGTVTGGQFNPAEWMQSSAESDTTLATSHDEPAPPILEPPIGSEPEPPRKLPPGIIPVPGGLPPQPPAPAPRPPRVQFTPNADGSLTVMYNPPPGKPGGPIKVTFHPHVPGQPDRVTVDTGGPWGPFEIVVPPPPLLPPANPGPGDRG